MNGWKIGFYRGRYVIGIIIVFQPCLNGFNRAGERLIWAYRIKRTYGTHFNPLLFSTNEMSRWDMFCLV